MKMNTKQLCVTLIFALAAVVSGDGLAKTKSEDIVNQSDNINAMFFWVADPTGDAFFDDVDPKDDAKDWGAIYKNSDQLVVLEPPSGDPLLMANEGKFKVKFDYTVKNVDVYWAEVFFDGLTPVVNASGNGHFDDKSANPNNKDWFTQSAFDDSFLTGALMNDINTHFGSSFVPTPVPIPSSVVLMLSAISMMSITRWRKTEQRRAV